MTDDREVLGLGGQPVADGKDPASGEPDLEAVRRVARATCAQWYKTRRESGYLVRDRKRPDQYCAKQVWPVIYHAFATGLIQEVPDE